MLVVLLVSIIVFLLMRLLPGDPVLVYVSLSSYQRMTDQEEIDKLRHEFGVDRPLTVQYFDWLGDLLHGDLGDSFFLGSSVTEEIKRALPRTLYVGLIAWIFAHLLGIPAGVICAIRRGRWPDTLITALANIGITAPIFWVGILLVYFFGLKLRLLPIQGYVSPFEDLGMSLAHIVMPAFCMALPHLLGSTRQTRSAMLEITQSEYIRTAWAKGLDEKSVVFKHMIRNGIMPVVTMAGITIPNLFGGSVLIETIFNVPGMGRLAVRGLWNQDYAIVQGVVLVVAVITVLVNFLVDLSYAWIDPRINDV